MAEGPDEMHHPELVEVVFLELLLTNSNGDNHPQAARTFHGISISHDLAELAVHSRIGERAFQACKRYFLLQNLLLGVERAGGYREIFKGIGKLENWSTFALDFGWPSSGHRNGKLDELWFYVDSHSFSLQPLLNQVLRLFVIWGYRRVYMILPMTVFFLVDALAVVFGIVSVTKGSNMAWIISNVALGGNGFLNLMLTVLIGARLWWKTHKIGGFIGGQESAKGIDANVIITIVLESGILYAIFLITYVILDFLPKNLPRTTLNGALVQAAGIAPTLIVARAISLRCGDHDFQTSNVRGGGVDVVSLTQPEFTTPSQYSITPLGATD
ncbi:hypothetical protein L218DRAFT_1055466 [Marasmius fiardii PR-910]|nr:hypothetical protein L218DRAFT_1055466 [Marasmius fiardii PR-910]